ncbi:MAG TPA: sulfotransferase [Steroidobacteraceae bacterium]|nr:sulfotransferase [Steroidobacteraceae bacterium]
MTEALMNVRLGRCATAERQLRAIQVADPGDVSSLHLLGVALLDQDKLTEALEALERAVAAAPRSWRARTDRARAWRRSGRLEEALAELQRVLAAAPALEAAWLAYGDALVDLKRFGEARLAYEQARLADPQRERIEEASRALIAKGRTRAEAIFREILEVDPGHLAALCGLAAVALGTGRAREAHRLLHHVIKQSAHLPLAWRGMCQALADLGQYAEFESAMRHLLELEPENPKNWVLLGTIHLRLMRQRDALEAFEQAARLTPDEVTLALSIGHIHKSLGNREECEAAYKACLKKSPSLGEAWWSLADLKTYVFSDAEIATMQALVNDAGGEDLDQAQLHFALGRAFEHQRNYRAAFSHYEQGNRRRRRTASFDILHFETKTRRVKACFDTEFFEARRGTGIEDPAPIFIVGLPRSGSTLVEQILASHPLVEGTFELPYMLAQVRELDHATPDKDGYPEGVRALPAAHFAELGRRYLAQTTPLRTGRAHFIDKMPNNFSHVGLIHTMLPRAAIIDVRRHPMDACFSTYKQHFAEGQSFSYDLEELGRYYRCYLELMDHWDEVLPRRVLRIRYEHLVMEPETHVRLLLRHLGLDFHPACLAFHETRRAVRTASAEQVRRPLYRTGIGYWRHFEDQLQPLKRALGSCLARFDEEGLSAPDP